MNFPDKAGDEHLGELVYCTQHLRVHATGWCTVFPEDKIAICKCPLCGGRPEVHEGSYPSVICSDCYDGAPDSGRQPMGSSHRSVKHAIEGWNETVEEWNL